MSNTPIKKSFLFKISPPFIRSLAPPNLLSIPKVIIPSKCLYFNNSIMIYDKIFEKGLILLYN